MSRAIGETYARALLIAVAAAKGSEKENYAWLSGSHAVIWRTNPPHHPRTHPWRLNASNLDRKLIYGSYPLKSGQSVRRSQVDKEY